MIKPYRKYYTQESKNKKKKRRQIILIFKISDTILKIRKNTKLKHLRAMNKKLLS